MRVRVRAGSGVVGPASYRGNTEPNCAPAGERGSGTVLAAGLGSVVMIIMVALLFLAQSATMASRAAAAADLAALAGADAARGITSGDPCAVAGTTAAQHEAVLVSCSVTGQGNVEVRTELKQKTPLGAASGRARAGPPP
ncbi:Rv3654c family TadE-like protein [Arthrobacter sp. ISL-30]|uniref:Rv3654c family TadE-like protein n=1 Tax=Arthrobacter sp. ISL-30 TaxID=2819109 RepID=UPI001BE6FB50|nr:Rv3654c family TadE-like protein [Arthrobacter sp. ISL-30]MBT2515068.1 flp pilus-assembly TadE/G-like family protein [Arthrobacter sp. ISL-30]